MQTETEGGVTDPALFLARAYAYTGADDLAVSCMEEAILTEEAARGENEKLLDLYLEYMDILNLTGQTELTENVIENCSYPDIQKYLRPYRVEKPSCDIPEGTYGSYLRPELEDQDGKTYNTLDGTEPTTDSTLYQKPITLTKSGETLQQSGAVK